MNLILVGSARNVSVREICSIKKNPCKKCRIYALPNCITPQKTEIGVDGFPRGKSWC